MDLSCLVVMGYWNAILGSKIDRRWRTSGRLGNHILVDLNVEFGLVNRYLLIIQGGRCGHGLLSG